MRVLTLFVSLMFINLTFAAQKAAQVTRIKGKVKATDPDTQKVIELKKKTWVKEGALVQTDKKSFVKLRFADGSNMSLGPSSKLTIAKFGQGKTALLNLHKGQLKAEVTKDPLRKSKSKLHIKTKSAAMGVRGTSFQTIYNEINNLTTLVTFEGEVAMVQIENLGPIVDSNQLETLISSNKAVNVKQGQFSGTSKTGRTNKPVKISPVQLNSMKKNNDFGTNQNANERANQLGSQNKPKKFFNIVPPGVDSKKFVNDNAALNESMKEIVGTRVVEQADQELNETKVDAPPPEGFVDNATGEFAPPAGGFIDPNTGIYIAPPPGSTFDANAGVYIPPPTMGTFDPSSGNYVPPEGFVLNPEGKFEHDQTEKRADQAQGPVGDKQNQQGPRGPNDPRGPLPGEPGKPGAPGAPGEFASRPPPPQLLDTKDFGGDNFNIAQDAELAKDFDHVLPPPPDFGVDPNGNPLPPPETFQDFQDPSDLDDLEDLKDDLDRDIFNNNEPDDIPDTTATLNINIKV